MSRREPDARATRPSTQTVSFRVDGRTYKRLESDAERRALSPHAYARQLVEDVLADAERERLREEVATNRKEVLALREDLATVLEMILINLTKSSEEDIRTWVSRNLRRKPSP